MSGSAARTPSGRRSDLRTTILAIIVLVLVSRIVLSIVGVVGAQVLDDRGVAEPAYEHIESARHDVSSWLVVHQWYNWDAVHYEDLSRHWPEVRWSVEPNIVTPDGGRAWTEFSWPPLFPLSIAAVHAVTGIEAGAAMLLLNLAAFGVFLFLVRCIVRADGHPESAARWAVAFNVCAPFAFFLSAPLTEPLFVCFAAGSLLAVRSRRWEVAGLLGAAMVWTKMTGVLMVAPLLVAAVLEVRRHRPADWTGRLRPFLAPAICAASYLAYLSFAWILTGTPRAPFLTQRYGWGNSVGNPVVNLVTNLDRWQYLAVAALLVLTVVLAATRQIGLVDATYCAVMLLSAATVVQIATAAPRYAAVAFPLATGVALWSRRRRLAPVLIGSMAGLQLGLFCIWTSYWLVEMV